MEQKKVSFTVCGKLQEMGLGRFLKWGEGSWLLAATAVEGKVCECLLVLEAEQGETGA